MYLFPNFAIWKCKKRPKSRISVHLDQFSDPLRTLKPPCSIKEVHVRAHNLPKAPINQYYQKIYQIVSFILSFWVKLVQKGQNWSISPNFDYQAHNRVVVAQHIRGCNPKILIDLCFGTQMVTLCNPSKRFELFLILTSPPSISTHTPELGIYTTC